MKLECNVPSQSFGLNLVNEFLYAEQVLGFLLTILSGILRRFMSLYTGK